LKTFGEMFRNLRQP